MNINPNSTKTNDIDVKSQLEHLIQVQETKNSGWVFDKINSMRIKFYKIGDLNSSSFVKIPLTASALINIKNKDKYCFLRSISAYLHPCENDHLKRVSNCEQCFNELNIEGFVFAKSLECSDFHNFRKVNTLSMNIFELNFYQDKDNWKQNLILIKISENDSNRVVVFLIYTNHFFPLKEYMYS